MSGLRPIAFITLNAFLMFLFGCATPGSNLGINVKEVTQEKRKSVVLFRCSAKIDSQKNEGSGRFYWVIATCDNLYSSTNNLNFYDFPSAEARKDGWVYFMLEPGTYYLEVSPKVDTLKNSHYFTPDSFWFSVPQGNKVIYIGTLSTACETTRGLISRQVDQCSEIKVIDQTESAKVIARASFRQYGSLSSVIMKPLSRPRTTRTMGELVPMGYTTTSTQELNSPNWKRRNIISAMGMGIGLEKLSFKRDGSSQFVNDHPYLSAFLNLSAPPVAILYSVYYLPVAFTGGVIAGEVSEHKWQPAIQGLQQELQENDPAAMLSSAFKTSLSQYDATAPINLKEADDPFVRAKQLGLKSIFEANFLNIELSECKERGCFCIVVNMRSRVWETASKNLLYDSVSQYSNKAIREKPVFFVTEVGGGCSECRKMEDYCGPEGRKFLKDELSKAIQLSVQKIFNDVLKENSR
ncbi:MAG: hypothetical protein OS130_04785 [Thermodesulfobacteriota bacterium]|nr:MAG: hypothetical protein OS130_04785 [Thermodesulfobacteriota bacterium]